MNMIRVYLVCCMFLMFGYISIAQNVSIQLGNSNIALNEAFTISLVIHDPNVKSFSGFPEIDGFKNHGYSSGSQTLNIQGKVSRSIVLTNSYQALKEGKYKLPPFKITVENETVSSNGETIVVGPAQKRQSIWDRIEEMRRRREEYFKQNQDFVDVKDDVFFSISSNKKEVYEGEGFVLTFALYVPLRQRQLVQMPSNFNEQLSDLIKKAIPKNCWEEGFDLQNISQSELKINGMDFIKVTYHQTMLYPLNHQDITIASYPLELVKHQYDRTYRQLGNSSLKKFYSKPVKIKVKPLPPHPLKDKVCVGDFKMVEKVNKVKLTTGEALKLNVKIYGEGNIKSITSPIISKNDSLDFFSPDIQTNINKNNGYVSGSKEFIYDVIPNEPSVYKLQDKLQFIYFNYKKATYDTLFPSIPLMVTGESHKNSTISDSDLGPFYEGIELGDNTLRARKSGGGLKLFVNIFILVMLAIIAFVIIKK